MRKTIVTGIAALLIGGLALPVAANASAPSQIDVAQVSVSFADLNIQNEAGARVLYARLKQASEKVCSVEPYREAGSLSKTAEAEQCYADALDKAVSRIDSDALKKIHSS
ncbi:MAG: UrcA family protein [Woeseiaceae bacterium]|nr:UrcA family protein [Woeseiaceae bacterium]